MDFLWVNRGDRENNSWPGALPGQQTHARKREPLNSLKKFAAAATAIALTGLVVAGCNKSRDNVVASVTSTGGLSVQITNKTVNGATVNLTQNGGTYTFTVQVTRNGTTLNTSGYTATWTADPNLLELTKNSDNSVLVKAKSINTANPTPVRVAIAADGDVAFDEAFVTIGQGGGGGGTGNLNIQLDANQRTVQINQTSIITVSANGQQLQSNQYNLELRDNPNNIGAVQVLNNSSWQFLANSNVGTADLFVNVFNFNGQSGSQTFVDAITVNTTGGGSSSSGVPGPTITAITINNPPGQATPGQPLALSMTATKDGNSTDVERDVNWWMDKAQLMNEVASVDADGRVFFRLAGTSVQITAWGKGQQQTFDSEERWAKAFRSNTVTVSSNNSTPNGVILVRMLAHMMPGMRWEYKVWNCNSGAFVFPGSGNTVTSSDPDVLAVNTSGTKWFAEPKKPGVATLNVSAGGFNSSFAVRVLPYLPQVQEYNGEWVIDTHCNFGPPHENPNNSAERIVPCVVSIDRINLRNGFPNNGDLYEMLFNGGSQGLNGTTPPVLSLQHVDSTQNNARYAVFYFRYLTDSGSENVSNFQYAEGTAPVQDADFGNSSKWRWPDFKVYSRWYGGSGNDNFKVTFTRVNPNSNPLDFRVTQG